MSIDLRQRRLALAYALLLLPTIVLQAAKAVQVNLNSPLDWVPIQNPSRAEYEEFSRTFGPGDVVVASWAQCYVDAKVLDRLSESLRGDRQFFASGQWLFDRVTTGREVFGQLIRQGISPDEAVRRLRGTLIGPDGRTTCVIVGFTKAGLVRREFLVKQLQQRIEHLCGVPPNRQHLAGPVIDGLTVDLASQATLQRLALPSSAVVFLAAGWCLRSWRAAVVVFAVSLYCQAVTLALISLCGDQMSALLVVLPPLLQVLSLAGGVHLVNYYRDAYAGSDFSTAARHAVHIGWMPCLLSGGTTAVGMASLMVSQLTPIHAFGAYATAGVLLTTVLVLVVVPSAAAAWKIPSRTPCESTRFPSSVRLRHSRSERLFLRCLSIAHMPLTITLLLLMLVSAIGMLRMRTSVRVETLFPSRSRILADYRWLESHVAPLVPVEVVVKFDASCALSPSQRLEWVGRLEDELRKSAPIRSAISARTFLPSLAQTLPPPVAGRILDQAVDRAFPSLAQQRWVVRSVEAEQWRIRGFVSSLEDLDYAILLRQLRQRLASALRRDGADLKGVRLQATGIMPLVHEIQQQLMHDLRASFLTAFLIITVVMTLLQGSVPAGIVAMVPNVFPTLLMFGVFGWSGTPVDVGSVMTASVALGVAVDDTLHFLAYFQRSLNEGKGRSDALLLAYQRCGPAMLQTSLICALGMSVFALSDFLPTSRFAWMMVGLFAAAIVGDLVFLPAMLMGPLGRLFQVAEIDLEPHASKAASTVNPGPNPSITHGPEPARVPIRSSAKMTVGDDMLP